MFVSNTYKINQISKAQLKYNDKYITADRTHCSNDFRILSNYFSMIIPYLSYHFNDINVKNEAKKVQKIKDIFVKQMKNMLDDYTLCLKRLL